MKKSLLTIYFLISGCVLLWAQTNPSPFPLSGNNYSFSSWDTNSSAGTYPASMRFWTFDGIAFSDTVQATGDWYCSYKLPSRPRFKGRNSAGVSMINTNNPQYDNCTSGATDSSIYVGAIGLSLNTTNCQNINVNWIGRMFSNLTYDTVVPQTRFFAIECQYRIGNTGNFQSFSNPALATFESASGPTSYRPANDSALYSLQLPPSCHNQPEVQLRWVYFQNVSSGAGARPELGVDDISVSSTLISGVAESYNSKVSLRPNPIESGNLEFGTILRFQVIDVLGRSVTGNSYIISDSYNVSSLKSGMYFIRTPEGNSFKFIKK